MTRILAVPTKYVDLERGCRAHQYQLKRRPQPIADSFSSATSEEENDLMNTCVILEVDRHRPFIVMCQLGLVSSVSSERRLAVLCLVAC